MGELFLLLLIERERRFGEDDFEEVGFAHVDFAYHPACAAAVPDVFFHLLGPPSAFGTDGVDVS